MSDLTMNDFPVPSYVLYYVFRHLHTPLRLIRRDGSVILEHSFPDFSDDIYYRSVIHAAASSDAAGITVFAIEQAVFYTYVPFDGCAVVFGPVRFAHRYSCHRSILLKDIAEEVTEDDFSIWYGQVTEADFGEYTECALLLANSVSEANPVPWKARQTILSENYLRADADDMTMASLSRLLFDKRESNFVHNPYNHELREVDAVERGDTEELNEIIHEDYTGRFGTLSNDALKQEIYLGIIVVTLTSRAAIRGGLSPEAAFYLSDTYIQALDRCTTPLEAINTGRRAEMHYARLVKELKSNRASSGGEAEMNPHIDRCKDYIYSHLHRKLQVQDIASAIGLEPNYLSALFKRCEHVTLKQYIINAKIRLVQNLLTYSDYSCIEIASYLGFTSQSHMGEHFRRVTGMTPRKYREKYRKNDFLHEFR